MTKVTTCSCCGGPVTKYGYTWTGEIPATREIKGEVSCRSCSSIPIAEAVPLILARRKEIESAMDRVAADIGKLSKPYWLNKRENDALPPEQLVEKNCVSSCSVLASNLYKEQLANGGYASRAAWSQCVRLATYRMTEASKGLMTLFAWLHDARTKRDCVRI